MTKQKKAEASKTVRHVHNSEDYVRFIVVSATPSALTTREVEEASESDPELKEVRSAINNGHFENRKAYTPIANEHCCIGQLVLRGTRIVVPKVLQPRALALAHEWHLGIVGTKQHIRSKVWWPGMDRAAEKYCESCHGCQVVSRPDAPELLLPTPLPDGPWQDVAIDLLGPLPTGHSILVWWITIVATTNMMFCCRQHQTKSQTAWNLYLVDTVCLSHVGLLFVILFVLQEQWHQTCQNHSQMGSG